MMRLERDVVPRHLTAGHDGGRINSNCLILGLVFIL